MAPAFRSTLRLGLAVLVLATPAAAQVEPGGDAGPGVAEGSVVVVSGSSTPASDATEGRPVGPLGAFVRSLLVPGWGQAALGEVTRGAFYFTMESASLWMIVKTQAKLDAARQAGDEDLIAARTQQREDWIVLAAFWALFAGVDAWVSAHLWGFEGELTAPPDGSPGAAISYRVPVGF